MRSGTGDGPPASHVLQLRCEARPRAGARAEGERRLAKLLATIGSVAVEVDPDFAQRWASEGQIDFLEVFVGPSYKT